MGYLVQRLRRTRGWSKPLSQRELLGMLRPKGEGRAERAAEVGRSLEEWEAKGEARREGDRWRVRHARDAFYTACFTDANGREHRHKAFRDKQASWARLLELEGKARAGLDTRDPFRAYRAMPVAEHLADFDAYLEARGTTGRYRREMGSLLARALGAMEVRVIGELTTTKIERFLAELVRPVAEGGRGLSYKSHNYSFRALAEFCGWTVERGRWGSDPTRNSYGKPAIKPRNVEAEPGRRRRQRRALTAEELGRLVRGARAREREELLAARPGAGRALIRRAELRGEERAVLYLAAGLGGLRRNELRLLTWGNCLLDAEPPLLVVWAEQAKAKREDTVPMAPSLAEALRAWRARGWAEMHWQMPGADDRVFGCVTNKVVPELHADARHAGLAVETGEGRLDLHALRHTLATLLARTGTPPQIAKTLTRHRSEQTLTRIYTHIVGADKLAAVGRLPRIELEAEEDGRRAEGGG